jgi:hypothetical protein
MAKFLIITLDGGGERYEDQHPNTCEVRYNDSHLPGWITIKDDNVFRAAYNPAFVISITHEEREED